MSYDKILILDLGCGLTRLLAHRIRSAYVYSEVRPASVNGDWLRQYAADERLKGIILSGQVSTEVGSEDAVSPTVFELGVPVLGIDRGMHVMARQLGGIVQDASEQPLASLTVRARGHTRLLLGIEDFQTTEGHGMLHAWMHEGSQVLEMPPGFKRMASSSGCAIAGMADEKRHFYGLQFHPEVAATVQGRSILTRFVLDICQASPHWVIGQYAEQAVQTIRERVGDQRVLLGLSGGVDSSVAAALIHRAIGDRLTCVFVDHGLLRLNEAKKVMAAVVDQLQVNVIHVDASQQFLGKLAGVRDPEQKRKIIGHEFIEVFKTEAAKLMASEGTCGAIKFLAQGTIYPDVIESGSKKKVAVKSHHNVGGLPEQLGLELLEPLRDLFKDEVRQLGLALGLPRDMVHRHPFPGPGLGVRILGEVKKEYADMLRQADAIYLEELRNANIDDRGQNWYEAVQQAFAVFLPVKSVGTTGDQRTYEYAVALRAVQTQDFMTADWADLPTPLLRKISSRIINEVSGINRVTYDISSKPPATIEWE